MKKVKILAILLAMVMLLGVCLAACNNADAYVITLDMSKDYPYHVEQGDTTVDYTQFFKVKDGDGNLITVTKDMLDTSEVDVSQVGNQFTVTLTVGTSSKTAKFVVVEKTGGGKDDQQQGGNTADLSTVLAKYADMSTWNFAMSTKVTYEGESYVLDYEYMGYNIKYPVTEDGETYTDYLGFDLTTNMYSYYYDLGDGSYDVYDENDELFDYFFYDFYFIYLDELSNFEFTSSGNGKYLAKDPNACGIAIIGSFDDGSVWTRIELTVSNEQITKIVATMSDGYTEEYTFSKHGQISFTLPNGTSSGSGGGLGSDYDFEKDADAASTVNIQKVLAKYTDNSAWNFAVTIKDSYYGDSYAEYYEYNGYNISTYYEYEGYYYTDYLGYDVASDTFYFYYDNGDGTYEKYAEGTYGFENYFTFSYLFSIDELANYTFTPSGNKFVANNPNACGNAAIGEYEDCSWTSVELYVANEQLLAIVAVSDGGWTETYIFSDYGQIDFTLPGASGSGSGGGSGSGTTSSGVMTRQTYTPSTFDDSTLQKRMLEDDCIGLPSTSDEPYHALVIPVQFSNDKFTPQELADLEIAFNGTEAQTGWESVASFYQKSSYGNLNIIFDVMDPFTAPNTYQYYETAWEYAYDYENELYKRYGEEMLLVQALNYYNNSINYAQYDTNDDGCIDAVYLIYSAPVDYSEYGSDFYWAYTTWFYGEEDFDGVFPYYYLFAGVDFIYESTQKDPGSGYDEIKGLTINANTYIHETGHLLGLDDYYDYDEDLGGNKGLGGADMMDYNVGDHNVYSKIMLGWITPTIVNDTTTLTIESMQAMSSNGVKAILIPLNFNNSYFCEYLLIDLYTATGLNALGAGQDNPYLYGGASFGVRIYHVSSSANNPYKNDYGSFTDYNNTDTQIALIKLIEADGETSLTEAGAWAASTDLWQTGSKLSTVFPKYTRNDGKLLCFDIEMVSVTETGATIKITFND